MKHMGTGTDDEVHWSHVPSGVATELWVSYYGSYSVIQAEQFIR